MSLLKLRYDPSISVKENAAKCGVTEAAVRKYIRVNNIDRRLDARISLMQKILKAKREHPNMTLRQIADMSGCSVNTVRKYLNSDLSVSEYATEKVSMFDITKPSTVIKSVSDSQDEILCNILRLYIRKDTFDCDLTYSVGNFYKEIEKPELKFDRHPQVEGVLPLCKAADIVQGALHSVVVDLPFIVNSNAKCNLKSKLVDRFDCFQTVDELYKANDYMIGLAHEKLANGGFLVVKTMDVCGPNGQVWVSNYVHNKAVKCGFTLEDIFILVARTKYLFARGSKQRHARKYHSYFFVFKKP